MPASFVKYSHAVSGIRMYVILNTVRSSCVALTCSTLHLCMLCRCSTFVFAYAFLQECTAKDVGAMAAHLHMSLGNLVDTGLCVQSDKSSDQMSKST